MLAGNGGRYDLAVLIDGVDVESEWPAGLAE